VPALKHTYTFEDEKEPFSSKDEIMFICKYNKPTFQLKAEGRRRTFDGWINHFLKRGIKLSGGAGKVYIVYYKSIVGYSSFCSSSTEP